MRAVRFHRHGPPADVLQLDDVPTPEPGPGHVRLRLTHRPVHPADLSMVKGTYGRSRALPAVGGNEGFGVVDAVGEGVSLAVGQRAIKLGEAPTWQEAVVLPEAEAFPVPDALADEAAAQLFVNPLTARLLCRVADLGSGDVLVQTAGASAVARIAAEMALARGARAVAIVRSGDQRDRLEALGATVVVADANTAETRAALSEAVGAGGAAAVFDPVAGDVGALALSVVREGGAHVVYGALSGAPLPVSPAALIYRDVHVSGVWRTRWAGRVNADVLRDALSELAADAVAGVFTLPVDATFDLADVAQAVRRSTAHGRWGKVLLTG
ncbi:zinc-dependent alcohol dehydrogenase family protein [Rubrivirga sp.]|uniref:zinc-dependent alcohol dehydrogenase family protein n=1 Tax=Rubrivirga sp. TaxID=1885344 RepID=UPI003B52EB3F